MKICNANRRWRTFNEHGFKVVLRFDRWGDNSRNVEKWLTQNYNCGSYDTSGPIYGKFGRARHWSNPNPYFIGLREPSIVSALLLCVQIKESDQ